MAFDPSDRQESQSDQWELAVAALEDPQNSGDDRDHVAIVPSYPGEEYPPGTAEYVMPTHAYRRK
jgi:hypothetical protein